VVQGADRFVAVLVDVFGTDVVVTTEDVVGDAALDVVLATEVVAERTLDVVVVVALFEELEQPAATNAIATNEDAATTRPHRRERGPSSGLRGVERAALAKGRMAQAFLGLDRVERLLRVVGCMLRQGSLVTAHPRRHYARSLSARSTNPPTVSGSWP
jgi:hypothetical protein